MPSMTIVPSVGRSRPPSIEQQGGLAAAGGSHDEHDFAAVDLEVEVVARRARRGRRSPKVFVSACTVRAAMVISGTLTRGRARGAAKRDERADGSDNRREDRQPDNVGADDVDLNRGLQTRDANGGRVVRTNASASAHATVHAACTRIVPAETWWRCAECLVDAVFAQLLEREGEEGEADHRERDPHGDDRHDAHDVGAHVADDASFRGCKLAAGLHAHLRHRVPRSGRGGAYAATPGAARTRM